MPTIQKAPKKPRQEYNVEKNDEARQLRKEFYSTSQWTKLRETHLKNDPLCQKCLSKGKITPADQVHHIISPFNYQTKSINWELALDDNNLESICAECHGKEHSHAKNKMSIEDTIKLLDDLFEV